MRTKTTLATVSLASAAAGALAALGISGLLRQGSPAPPVALESAVTLVLDEAAARRFESPEGTAVSLADPRLSLRQIRRIGEQSALADPAAAVLKANEIPGYDNREAYLGEVLRTWGEADGLAAVLWVREHFQGEQLADALYYVADGWAETDPEGAADWFLEHTTGTVLDDALWEAMEAWGRQDPLAAVAWSEKLDDYQKWMVMDGLADGWAAIDPAAAAAAGLEWIETDFGYDFLVSVASQWAGSGPLEAAAWAATIRNERVRAGVLGELGDIWARTDPRAAAAWAESIADPGSRSFAEDGIALGWTQHDPGGAMEWVLASIQDAGRLDDLVGDITFNWSNHDPNGAARWLESRPPGPEKDRVLVAFSDTILEDDPLAAAAWAAEIREPVAREAQLRSVLQNWVALYGDSAKEQIRALDLPASLKEEFAR